MNPQSSPPNIIQRSLMRVASLAMFARLGAAILHQMDRFVMRMSRQRHSATSLLTGQPLIWLTTTGARSGKLRTVPLLAIDDGLQLILVASNWGQQQHPSWYYNLRATPQVTIKRGAAQPIAATAREVEGSEYDRCWAVAVARYAGYDAYRSRTTRHIPLFILEPLSSDML
jgi:deazaflavin-dependent oxidoreductase (nitroreductase family)